jgi:hypothetical protein
MATTAIYSLPAGIIYRDRLCKPSIGPARHPLGIIMWSFNTERGIVSNNCFLERFIEHSFCPLRILHLGDLVKQWFICQAWLPEASLLAVFIAAGVLSATSPSSISLVIAVWYFSASRQSQQVASEPFEMRQLPPMAFHEVCSLGWPAGWLLPKRSLFRYNLVFYFVNLFMKISLFAGALAVASAVVPALGATYSKSESIVGADFFSAFNFEAETDPTHGRVWAIPICKLVLGVLIMPHLQELRRPIHCRQGWPRV